jgi:hypothetical protein
MLENIIKNSLRFSPHPSRGEFSFKIKNPSTAGTVKGVEIISLKEIKLLY